MRITAPRTAAAVLFSLAACALQPAALVPSHPAPPPTAPPVPAPAPPRWTFLDTAERTVSLALPDATRLEVGASGERWLLAGPHAFTSSTFLPEPIACIARSSDDELDFVGAHGTVYPVAARDPLGPILAPRKPPRAFAQVTAGKRAILGAFGDTLYRSTDGGRTWASGPVDGAPRVVASIAMTTDGVGAVLLRPQRTLGTVDDGASWTRVSSPPFGLIQVGASHGLVLANPLEERAGTFALTGAPPRWARPPERSESPEPPRVQVSESVLAGSVIVGAGYDGERSAIFTQDLGESGGWRHAHDVPSCGPAALGASVDGRSVVLVCPLEGQRDKRNKSKLAVWRTSDSARTWHEEDAHLVAVKDEQLVVAVRGDGETLIAGARTSAAAAAAGPAFVLGGPAGYHDLLVDADADTSLYVQDAAFAHGSAIVFGGSGNDAVVLVARDGDASLRLQRLGGYTQGHLTSDGEIAVAPASTDDGWVLQASRDGGESWTSQRPAAGLPSDPGPERIALAGARGLAVVPEGTFETLDGARTWSRIEAPRVGDSASVRCNAEACTLGDHVRRVGWSAASGSPLPSPPSPVAAASDGPKASEAAPIRCVRSGRRRPFGTPAARPVIDADDGARWVALVEGSPEPKPKLPARSAQILEERWTEHGFERTAAPLFDAVPHGSVPYFHADEHGAVTVVYPARCTMNCESYVYAEGPSDVAWATAREPARVHRARVTPTDAAKNATVSARVLADGRAVVSFASYDDLEDGEAWVIDAAGRSKRTPESSDALARIGGKSVAVRARIYGDLADSVMMRAAGSRDRWSGWALGLDAPSLGLPPEVVELTRGLVTRGERVIAWMQAPERVLLVPVGAIDTEPASVSAVDVASLLGHEPPAACSPAMRRGLRVHYELPKPWRQVVVDGDDTKDAIPLTVAVVRVAESGSACVSALVAAPAYGGGTQVALFPDAMGRSVLFRPAGRAPSPGEAQYVEDVSCVYAP